MPTPPRTSAAGPQRGPGSDSGSGSTATPAGKRALERTLRRSRDGGKRKGGILAPLLIGIIIVLVLVTGTSVLIAGGAGAAMLASLEADLPDVKQFETLQFAEPTVVYDNRGPSGGKELARFFSEKREVVQFDDIPKLVLDATTSVEDRSFWENQGIDLVATLSALAQEVSGGSDRGGGSTITQQLVRARLLPRDLVTDPDRLYERKAKEIIQSYKLTQAFPGEEGKERIITAYLNQIFYGHNAYGIKAAAEVYFGAKLTCDEEQKNKGCKQLTLGQAALLAGLPQSPSILDPYRFAKQGEYIEPESGRTKEADLLVPNCNARNAPEDCTDIQSMVRRKFILDSLLAGYGRWTKITPEEYQEALEEPLILRGDRPSRWTAPHFVWAMRGQLDTLLADRDSAETGGYAVTTTLDMRAQTIAEKYVRAAAEFTQLGFSNYLTQLKRYKVGRQDRPWLDFLRGKSIKNAALVAVDYRTGNVIAYVGSANYYGKNSKRMDPKYDVIQGYRQSGSAWKPILYATAIDNRTITAGSVILDVTTPFGGTWDPKNAGMDERGPVLARKALQYSLNIPAIRVQHRVGPATVGQYSARAGISFLGGRKSMTLAGLAGAIGTVETRMLDLVSAYGSFGNDGFVTTPRFILKVTRQIKNADGTTTTEVIYDAPKAERKKFVTPQTAYIIADILSGNTNPAENIYWGPKFQLTNGPGGSRRPAALKTGTTNGIRDLSAYGLLPAPQNQKDPAIALGVWMGNSDHTQPTLGGNPLFASDGPAQVWHAFLRDYMRGEPIPEFQRPAKGLVERTIDAFTGGKPGPWTRDTVSEWFIAGTEPGARGAIDTSRTNMYVQECGTWMIDLVKVENRGAPSSWKAAVRDWMARARRGTGVASRIFGTTTRYLEARSSWGGRMLGPCATPSPTPDPNATPEPGETTDPDPGKPPKPPPKPTRKPGPGKTPKPTPPPDNNG